MRSFKVFLRMIVLTLILGGGTAFFSAQAHAGGRWGGHGGHGHGGGWRDCDDGGRGGYGRGGYYDGGYGRGYGRGHGWKHGRRPNVVHNNYYGGQPYAYGVPVPAPVYLAPQPVFPNYGHGYNFRPRTDVFFGINVSQ